MRQSWNYRILLLAVACSGCADEASPPLAEGEISRVARSSAGMVVSSSEPAAKVGADILRRGGNAVDAAVAMAFALAVTEPTQSGLGGRTQALVWRPTGQPFGVDATTVVPLGATEAVSAQDGYQVIGVPGTVAGLARVFQEAGSLDWPEVVAPAIQLAEEGFPLPEGEAGRLAGIADRLALSEGARSSFLDADGAPLAPGDVLRQPALARVLRSIAEDGPEVFYSGWIADAMLADLAEHRAAVAQEDLSSYVARPAIVVSGTFHGSELVGTYLPASGATVIEALQILERIPLLDLDPDRRALAVGDALVAAFVDRETARADSRSPEQDAAWVVSTARADARAAEILEGVAPGTAPLGGEPSETSHLSVVDGTGLTVAMTQSLGPTGGSRVATPGLGFLYATTLGYLDATAPGGRPWSSQAPLVVLKQGRPAYVLGGAGGRRIVSAIVQTLVRTEVEGLGIEEAIGAARFHPTERWHFEQLDPASEPAGADLALRRGHRVLVRPFDYYFGRLNVIAVGADGELLGVADPRWEWGAAAGSGETRDPA